MVSDELILKPRTSILDVSIRFKVRGGFRRTTVKGVLDKLLRFQSALRFAVVSDFCSGIGPDWNISFQSALRFAAVSDHQFRDNRIVLGVSIRFEVCGGFRRG